MGGETSRHRGRFRIVFYYIKVDFCYSIFNFHDDAWFGLCHADVHFVLYFTHQDALLLCGSCVDFGCGGTLLGVTRFEVGQVRSEEFMCQQASDVDVT